MFSLQGPFPFDPELGSAGARAALAAAREGGPWEPARGDLPGLYLIWRREGEGESQRPPLLPEGEGAPIGADEGESQSTTRDLRDRALVGFWLSFGPRYLVSGPVGAPVLSPPFAAALLTAATEEIWWEGLPLWSGEADAWAPLIVLEYLPGLAARAAVYPPGTERSRLGSAEEHGIGGRWLDTGWDEPRATTPTAHVSEVEEGGLPARRSLVTVLRGELFRRRDVARGRYALVAPERLPRPAAGVALPLETWLTAAAADSGTPPTADAVQVGPALALPGDRVGFALPVWLTRGLSPWPTSPREVRAATLPDRDVGGAWRGQLRAATTVTSGVLAIVLGVAASVWVATQPKVRAAPPLPQPAAQPVLSLCSADHQAFVARLRCQVRWLSSGGAVGEATCDGADAGDDLQADWCGLADRALDGWTWKGENFAEIAASQACFEVLGQPWPYAAPKSEGRLGDPARFLRDANLGIRGLATLVSDLDARCGRSRDALEARLTGAVVAAHIGASGDDEAGALQGMVAGVVAGGLSPELKGCFDAGLSGGAEGVRAYDGLCAAAHTDDGAWAVLGGAPGQAGLVDRYVRARFGAGPGPDAPALWSCDATLRSGGSAPVPAAWDLTLSAPVRSQLVLDAGLRTLQAGANNGPCWGLLSDALSLYTSVYPALGEPDPAGWPSAEQQLCGQVCAVRYRLAAPAQTSLTLGTDLGICLDRDPPADRPDLGKGSLDRLRLPWNGDERSGWHSPTDEQICAFNLIAQGWLQDGDPALLADGASPAGWAGETGAGSRIAGGTEGLAAQGVVALGRYGRARSLASCEFVAAECFTEELLAVTGDTGLERHQWRERWRRRVSALSTDDHAGSPWCGAIRDYLSPSGDLPEGELDYPCARGVEDARAAVEARLVALASGGKP